MSDTFNLLSDGLRRLCHNDPAVERLTAPRIETILSLLSAYITEIELYNAALSLVGTNDRQELISGHILDSLAPLALLIKRVYPCADRETQVTARPAVADVGSGAGLPGIPLAIVMPDVEFTLIERKGRRAGFLRNTITALNLANVFVEEAEMEKVKPGRFSVVTFRAFRPLEPKIYKKLIRLCGKGACLAAYKGRREKTLAEASALEAALPDIAGQWELIPCPVPFLDKERHLLIIEPVPKTANLRL